MFSHLILIEDRYKSCGLIDLTGKFVTIRGKTTYLGDKRSLCKDIYRQIVRQTDRQTDRQIDGQIGVKVKKTEKTSKQSYIYKWVETNCLW